MMKPLDELINKLECYPVSPSTLPCSVSIVTVEDLDDALHYLKEYQKIEDEYEELKDWWAEEHAENVPLTWDELKRMNGKPVWVEGQYPHSWCIVREVQKYMDGTEEIVLDGLNCKIGIGRKEKYGTGWQAYRKERE